METHNGKTKEIWGRKFRIVKNGLDEAEVFAFVSGLIEQNKDLASKLEHIDSLRKLAEKTVIEADRQAENIKREIAEEANIKATAIIAEAETKAKEEADRIVAGAERRAEQQAQEKIVAAEQRAQDILKEAQEKADTLKTNAGEEANGIVAEAKQNATAIEQQAQDIIKEAHEKAEKLKTHAERTADKILGEVKEKAEDILKAKTAKAEKEAQHILREAKERAEEEALLIKEKADQLLIRSKRIAENELKDKFKRIYQELLSDLESPEGTTTMLIVEETKVSEPEATLYAQAETLTKEPTEQPSPTQEGGEEKESLALYDGTVELVIPPPIGLDRMLQLHKHLRSIPQIEVLNLGVSADKSITIRLTLERPAPLIKIIEGLPEVEKASASEPQDAEAPATAQKTEDKPPVKRIIVTTQK